MFQQMIFDFSPTPNALPDEPAEYFRSANPGHISNEISYQNIAFERPSTPNALSDEPAEYFRPTSPDLPSHIPSEQAIFERPPTPNALPDEPAEYFRPADPGHISNEISPSSSSDVDDEPAEYFRPANPDPAALQNEISPYQQLDGQTDFSDLINFNYFANHSTDENLKLNRLLQPHYVGDQSCDGDGTETGYAELDDIDARLVAALTGVVGPQGPGDDDDGRGFGFGMVAPRHDCPNCNCGI